MRTIFRTEFGSQLYGTSLPTSDVDYKSIFIPDFKDIILQRAPRNITIGTKTDKTTRNTKDDIDDESFSLQEYCRLLCDGQTVALDMLFSTEKHIIENNVYWEIIQANKDKFLHKGTSSFVGYTKQQAAKYGVKGFRVSAVEEVLKFLKTLDPNAKLKESKVHYDLYRQLYDKPGTEHEKPKNEHAKLVEITDKTGTMLHLEVCNRKVPFHASVKYAIEVYQRIWDEYGARAQLAKDNQGIDWKALMHSVRVAREAEELLLTGHITFPRPEKDILLQIRKGELDYETKVAPLIEEGLVRIEEAKNKSILPDSPNKIWVDSFIFNCYTNLV